MLRGTDTLLDERGEEEARKPSETSQRRAAYGSPWDSIKLLYAEAIPTDEFV